MPTQPFTQLRRDNEQIAGLINIAWGEKVAWVEDRAFTHPSGGIQHLPVVVSHLVAGKLPWRRDVPAFFAGPAVGRVK